MDELENNIRKLRQYDDLGESIYAIEKLVEEVLRVQEEKVRTMAQSPDQDALQLPA